MQLAATQSDAASAPELPTGEICLAHFKPIGFIPTADPANARALYEGILGLTFESDDQFAMVFRVGPHNTMLRIARTPDFKPAPFTIFGWEVDDIDSAVASLTAKGVHFLILGFMPQEPNGVWTRPEEPKSLGSKTPTATPSRCPSIPFRGKLESTLP